MKLKSILLTLSLTLLTLSTSCDKKEDAAKSDVKDLSFFLEQMLTMEHLPTLEDSQTAMSSTWDRTGGNWDGNYFERNDGTTNVLCEVDGPGFVNRIYTGRLQNLHYEKDTALDLTKVRMQIFIDSADTPIIDCSIHDFFVNNPIAKYPFVFDNLDNFKRTYPGFILPIPFAKHLKVQLVSPTPNPYFGNWGSYWQITYKTYPNGENVKSLTLPLSDREKELMNKVANLWNAAEIANPQLTNKYNSSKSFALKPQEKNELIVSSGGRINELRVKVTPNTPEAWRALRLKIYWDDQPLPSIDAPAGYFFGNADYADKIHYSSLFIGQDSVSPYSRIPMPYKKNAKIELVNDGKIAIDKVEIFVDNDSSDKIKENEGYLHATWNEQKADSLLLPKWGKKNVQSHLVLQRDGIKGKFIGTILYVAWPIQGWWGEGDVLVWSDEDGFPPSYHGTGTEEYFNCGWSLFDRKAISGHIKAHPGNVGVYSFHLIDDFNFEKKFRMLIEEFSYARIGLDVKAIWGTTAFWYGEYPTPAFSRQDLVTPRLIDKNPDKWESEVWE